MKRDQLDKSCLNVQISLFKGSINKLNISSPEDFGGGLRAVEIFQDTLAYVLPTKPIDKIFIIDLKNQKFLAPIHLDRNFITAPSGIQAISSDSIFVSEQNFPQIHLIDNNGVVLESVNLYRENLWKMPKEGFPNFGLYFGFGKTFHYDKSRNSLFFPLKQLDIWYFVQEKNKFPVFAEYSLSTNQFLGLHGEYPGVYGSKLNSLLPFFLSHPIMEVFEKQIILSYPLDEELFVYDLDGNFLFKKCASISDFHLGLPLEYDMENFDSEGLRKYHLTNSYFGNFFFISGLNKFSRIFLKSLITSQGTCKAKKVFVMTFDINLDLESVTELPIEYPCNYFTYQTAYNKGVLSKSSVVDDDLFPLSDIILLDN
ncbi:protein of unknown function [Algoriphagus ornithinivorans]|uniref:TolB-like 6-blade propeller-like n=2 Tax=Algoriphagus ornithinivorans TaxID=226506 RepID=A0A1I5HTP0_9BACT|nr:protein of unknown function [Algoriphagus ornithinivorans]